MSKLQDAKKQYSIDGTSANAYKLICELEKSNDEMLEALIDEVKHMKGLSDAAQDNYFNVVYKKSKIVKLIEKATGQKIEELI